MSDTIGLDYTAAIHQGAGIGRYVREMAGALVRLRPETDFRLFAAGVGGRESPLAALPARLYPSPLSERTHNRLWHRLRLPLPVEWWTGRLDPKTAPVPVVFSAISRRGSTVLSLPHSRYRNRPARDRSANR